MRLSDSIETFIKTLLAEDEPEVELKRNELAEYFGCAPSQINYVLATRFSPDHGYLIESRRGGGGYIRITRVHVDRQTLMMHVINSIGSEIDPASARAILSNLVQSEAIPAQTGKLLVSLLSDTALRSVPKDQRSVLRADLLKQALIHLV